MKFFKLYILIFCFFPLTHAQQQLEGKIIYKYDIQENNGFEDEKNQNVISRFKRSLKENSDKIKYELVFKESEANYKLKKI